MSRITLRIDLDGHGSIGPGKVRLLELVADSGSMQKAAAAMAMSYAHAWKLIQETGATFGAPRRFAFTLVCSRFLIASHVRQVQMWSPLPQFRASYRLKAVLWKGPSLLQHEALADGR